MTCSDQAPRFARRWRDCNRASAPLYNSEAEEDEWRTTTLGLLSRAHTLGAISDISFEVVESKYADIAFELEGETFKWRWETCFLGHKASAEIISKHLIFPLISLNHMAFSSPLAVSELSDADVEQAVDKVGRTARRSVDTHIKNAISKPRMASALRRMTAMFNFIPDLPPVISTAEKPDLQVAQPKARLPSPVTTSTVNIPPHVKETPPDVEPVDADFSDSRKPPIQVDSATESEGDDSILVDDDQALGDPSSSRATPPISRLVPLSRNSPVPRVSPGPSTSKGPGPGPGSDSDSSPVRPPKKLKTPAKGSSSDDDSEEERRRRVAQLKSGGGSGGGIRGTRQPIKRGGKRF
ncbi:hypothetical protein D9615_009553 [Tricholomella constricta]|uniref:Uncharacterized protein n=1 Tax=Tricholomella constricta TaxID=117010 RepID=A0A8H5GVK6_9AGAR|nr:hypothetical protein D9615_009553 [Tricholomella constricta]